MGIESEISGRLKGTLLCFVLVLIGAMSYFVFTQFHQISAIYAATDNVTVLQHPKFADPAGVDSASPTP